MQAFLARWMPIDVSAHGAQLDQLTALVHWLMAILFVGWGIYFVYVLFRFRASANPEASYEGATSHFSQYVEAGVAIVEVVLLVGFAIPAWAAWVSQPPADAEPFEVRVVAQQFAWNVHYAGPDGEFGTTRAELIDDADRNFIGLDRSDPAARDDVTLQNVMYLPVDRDIVVHLTSRDVVHSFFLPQMRVKQDAIPGMTIPVHFRALEETPEEYRPGNCAIAQDCWEIACAQLCGITHYRMRGTYAVVSQAEFDTWLQDQVAQLPSFASAAAPGDRAVADGSATGAAGR